MGTIGQRLKCRDFLSAGVNVWYDVADSGHRIESQAGGIMPNNNRASLVIPVLIIVVGLGWLLTALGYAPDINWLWTLGLGVIGILTFVRNGLDKVSVVVGPTFLVASVLSVLRQTGNLTLNVEVPVLVIGVGILMLVARLPGIPQADWLKPPQPQATSR